jgi:hypothetical protein
VCVVRGMPLGNHSDGKVQCSFHAATRKDDDLKRPAAGAYSSLNFVFSCLCLICGVFCVCIACSLIVLAMAKAACSVQASLHKFLYNGRISNFNSSDFDSLRFTGAQFVVKTEIESPHGSTLGSQGSVGSTPPFLVADKAQPTLLSKSDYLLIETKSTPAKACKPNLVVLDAKTASPS